MFKKKTCIFGIWDRKRSCTETSVFYTRLLLILIGLLFQNLLQLGYSGHTREFLANAKYRLTTQWLKKPTFTKIPLERWTNSKPSKILRMSRTTLILLLKCASENVGLNTTVQKRIIWWITELCLKDNWIFFRPTSWGGVFEKTIYYLISISIYQHIEKFPSYLKCANPVGYNWK